MGLEVIAGDTIIQYGISLGIELDVAKSFTTLTMAAMITGYLIGVALIPKYLSQQTFLYLSSILGLVFIAGILLSSGITSVVFVALLGL